jgi:hypothetical protein
MTTIFKGHLPRHLELFEAGDKNKKCDVMSDIMLHSDFGSERKLIGFSESELLHKRLIKNKKIRKG